MTEGAEKTNGRRGIHLILDVQEDALERALTLAMRRQQTDIRWISHFGVRDESRLREIIEGDQPELVFYHFYDRRLDTAVRRITKETGVLALDVFDPILKTLDYAIHEGLARPRNGRRVAGLFDTIDALEFAVKHDDGKNLATLPRADLVLIGVSRTSKTPLSIYLAHYGLKVGNVPIIPGVELPDVIRRMPKNRLIGLGINPRRLTNVRRARADRLPPGVSGDYARPEAIIREVSYAEDVMRRLRCFVIDVSHRAIEETAAEILKAIGREETG